jgi:RNA polymerase subunit RPABC4/transcription elongation factor Spt4
MSNSKEETRQCRSCGALLSDEVECCWFCGILLTADGIIIVRKKLEI